MKPQRLDRVLALLLAATGLTWALAESGGAGALPATRALLVLGLALLKGIWIAQDFMELRQAPRVWRRFMLGWLIAVLGLILGFRLLA
ncbi:hypothetical protein HNQ51_000632 [Inhella inkyongensis]|uniref:Cytochrome c oxidase subunit IV n=1 Tax=Inhella inkyongensis TaxID=392593 RepID=A0A840S497_9BURK|nr:cytochrome C oxidase subunit IV family protein [Inhella inkyongensis]MBB5203339.1 hypothetical protein [Inhella inkyongensis]